MMMMMKIALVAIDETHLFDQFVTNQTGRLYCVYMYDPDEQTNCCESTPSYWLEPLYYVTENPVDDELDADMQKSLDKPGYCQCYLIDELPPYLKTQGEFEDMDAAREYWCGNRWEPEF
jgi:hypothetical protein